MDNNLENLVKELKGLDKEIVEIDGSHLKPSQCYHFETDPVHILFNTNCPEDLRQKIQNILTKYLPADESRAS